MAVAFQASPRGAPSLLDSDVDHSQAPLLGALQAEVGELLRSSTGTVPAGMHVSGPADPSLATIRTVA